MVINTKAYHPAAKCQVANKLYWQWVRVPDEPIYRKEFQDAKARYQLHLSECEVCRELLNAIR